MIAVMETQNFSKIEKEFSQFQSAYALSIELDKVQQENMLLKAGQQQLAIKVASLEEEIARLKEQLQLAQARHFGKKRDLGELPLANDKTQSVAGYTRKSGKKSSGRLVDLSSLPGHKVHHDLADTDKICQGCDKPLHFIETETSEQLEILPQRFYRVEHIRYKYGCYTCKTIQMGFKEPSPLPKALAGSGLLTEVVINKYQYHLPLYRQSTMMASLGVVVPDNTLGNWVMQLGDALSILYEAFWKAVLASRYLQVDETPVKVLQPEKKGYLWGYYAPLLGKGLIVFEMSLTRDGDIAIKRLSAFNGLLQTDGYSGYQALRNRNGIIGFGCVSHARRKFSDVLKITKNPNGIAAQAIEKLKPLYDLERHMREKNYSHRIRKKLRQQVAWPILKNFHTWLKKTLPSVPPKSQLARAIQYTFNQWPYLIKYLRHGMAEIDTNWVEGEIRGIALGRKNWLFIGNQDSGKIHAFFYSLISSAVLNGLNPRLYLHYIITKVHELRRGIVTPEQLLPHIIDRDVLQKFSDKLLAEAKEILNSS
jgi:transposase